MIFLGKITPTLEEARELAQQQLLDGSGYRKFKEVIEAQGGNPQVLDRFELLPNATGVREITSPRAGYVSAIDAEDIGLRLHHDRRRAATRKEDTIDPAVGVILEVKVGQKVDAGAVLCRLYYTKEEHVEEAAEHGRRRLPHLRAAARRARTDSGSRRLSTDGPVHRPARASSGILAVCVAVLAAQARHSSCAWFCWGLGLQFAFAFLVLKTASARSSKSLSAGVNAMLDYAEDGSQFVFGPLGAKAGPFGVVFAFQVLPIVIFIASLFAILYYLGVMQVVVRGMAVVMQKRHGRQRRRIH